MEAIKFKFITSQARSIYHYKKLKIKVLKYNADIYFNKQCLAKSACCVKTAQFFIKVIIN